MKQFLIGEWVEIEEPVANLVRVMNEIPGLTTLTCCGGHPEEEQQFFDQVDEGCFYITFCLDEDDSGWEALHLVSLVLGNDGGILSLCVDGDEEVGPSFFISGDGQVSADEVAVRLANLVESH